MAAFPPDLSDCVDNRLPFWSGEMLKQLKTLINTPGKTYADLMADARQVGNTSHWFYD